VEGEADAGSKRIEYAMARKRIEMKKLRKLLKLKYETAEALSDTELTALFTESKE
jgi:hypothetical protein